MSLLADQRARSGAVGELLVVLGRCRHSRSSVLINPTGAVVAASPAADLLYRPSLACVVTPGEWSCYQCGL